MNGVCLAIIDPFHPSIINTIRAAVPDGWSLAIAADQTPDGRAAALEIADMAFVMAAPMPVELLRSGKKLRFIQKLGIGVDRIDTGYCEKNGISVARLQGGNAIPVAEHTVMLILAAYRRLPVLDRQTRAGAWDKETVRGNNRHLFGKTVGIVGFGAIGRRVARLLASFEVSILYYDPMRAPEDVEQELEARYLSLDDLIAEADVVSLHLPLLKETAGLIDAGRIRAMKPGAILVNCARGGLVDEAALAEALAGGHLFGAALDAFSEEPPLGNPLLASDNTVITPHCAGATIDNFSGIMERAVHNAQAFLAGVPLPEEDVVVGPSR
ncbi:MAG: 2-hydroxyacid dehydrogenase [Rhodospirillales bacterium]|nr:2-hydroxyacid dehydrogenase [Rhodospirillales bacterium]